MNFDNINIEISKKELLEDGYTIVPIFKIHILEEIKKIIKSRFTENQLFYNNMDRKEWHKKVLSVQDIINNEGLNITSIKCSFSS